jgi:glutamate synthase domain-containing protein 2
LNTDEPHLEFVQELAEHGLTRGARGPVDSLGVKRSQLPSWDDIQILTAQLAKLPLLDGHAVETRTVIGPGARKPVELKMPLLIADLGYGSLSIESKTALACGAELAGAGLCSGEAGVLKEEYGSCSRYFVQMGPAKWGFSFEKIKNAQALHLKIGQAAKTGTGGLLVGSKATGRVAEVHGVPEGKDAVAPARFTDFNSEADFKKFLAEVRDATGGIPVGFKMSAQKIEDDIAAAVRIGVDYIILDGRGGGTAASPVIFRDHIGVPAIPALARARRKLDELRADKVSLIVTGGLRTPPDFIKALALGADAVAIGSSALHAIGCNGQRQCHLDTCSAGIATQNPELRARFNVDENTVRLGRFLTSCNELMKVLSRACGHERLSDFSPADLTAWNSSMAALAGISFAGPL